MRKTWIVARSEYIRAVRTKAFIIGVLLMPVLMGAGGIMIMLEKAVSDVEDRHFAVVDRTGELEELIRESAETRNAGHPVWSQDDPPVQNEARFLLEPGGAGPEAEAALAERVRRGELLGYLVIGADIIREAPPPVSAEEHGEAGEAAAEPAAALDVEMSWHTQNPAIETVRGWLGGVINREIQRRRRDASGIRKTLVSHVTEWTKVENKGLPGVTSTGMVKEAQKSNEMADIGVPAILTLMIYMLMLMNAPALMNNVLEEKMQKIAEVLISAVSPFQLVLGKVISAVMVAFTLMVIYVGAALIMVHVVDEVPQQVRDALSPGLLAWFAFFLLMGLIILGSMCAALGAACSEIRDAQSLMMPVILSVIVPLFFIAVVIKNPNGTVSQLVSYFPTATPLLMFLRVAIPPGVPWWELVLSVVSMLFFSTLCILAGAKIFRVGILMQGQTPSLRKIFSWIRSG
jgi:ABC-type Na+ efflux pump permease subunit